MTKEQMDKYLTLYKNGVRDNDLKTIMQSDAINATLQDTRGGAILAYTGFGKGHMVTGIIKRYRVKYSDIVIIVVPTRPLKEEFEKIVLENFLLNVKVYTREGYLAQHVKKVGLFIVDELHTVCVESAEMFATIIPDTVYDYFFGFSATLEDKHKDFLKKNDILIKYTVNKIDAHRLRLLPEHTIYNIGVDLTTQEQRRYQDNHRPFTTLSQLFQQASEDNSFQVAMICCTKDDMIHTVKGKKRPAREVKQIVARKLNMEINEVVSMAFAWKKHMNNLGDIVDNAVRKKILVEEILEKFDHLKTILFCASIEQAEQYAKEHANNMICYHSKSKRRGTLLKAFLDGFMRKIASVEALDMGVDDAKIELGLNIKYTSTALQMVQRIGRVIRKDVDRPDKKAIFVNIYCNPFVVQLQDGDKDVIKPSDYNKLKDICYREPVLWLRDAEEMYDLEKETIERKNEDRH